MSIVQKVQDFFKPYQATLTDAERLANETNALIQLVNERRKFDPCYVSVFGIDYFLVSFTVDEQGGIVEFKHAVTDETYLLPTSFVGIDTIHSCLLNYCFSRSLIINGERV